MTSPAELVRAALVDGVRVRQELIAAELPAIVAAGELIAATLAAGGKVLLCGNGGSAADAQHIAAELVGRFVVERRGLPAIALTTDSSALTAIGNDYGYEHVFRRQVEALGRAGDLLIAITTSGTSKNVVAAADAARALGLRVVGLTGARGRAFVDACDGGVVVPSGDTARIQECHIAIGHVWCAQVDAGYAPAPVLAAAGAPKLYDQAGVVAFRERCRARQERDGGGVTRVADVDDQRAVAIEEQCAGHSASSRARVSVDERPGTSGTNSTLPPQLATSAASGMGLPWGGA